MENSKFFFAFLVAIIHWRTDITIQADFMIRVLACTAQTTKSMKTNDTPFKSPIKLQQEMKKKFGIFQNLLDF